ncbi:MAG: PASTA domain-containing protein [bacterium]
MGVPSQPVSNIAPANADKAYPHPLISCMMPFIAIMVLLIIGLFAFVIWQASLPGDVTVPSVDGKTQAEATSELTRTGFRVEINAENEASDVFPAGTVTRSAPTAGRRVKHGRTVILTLSAGSIYTSVPDTKELPLMEAQEILRKAGLQIANEQYVYNEDLPYDRVINISPAPGSQVKRGGTVDLLISQGAQLRAGESATSDQRSSVLRIVVPKDAKGPDDVHIDVTDDDGKREVYRQRQNPGDEIVTTVQGSGKMKIEVYYGPKIILARYL